MKRGKQALTDFLSEWIIFAYLQPIIDYILVAIVFKEKKHNVNSSK